MTSIQFVSYIREAVTFFNGWWHILAPMGALILVCLVLGYIVPSWRAALFAFAFGMVISPSPVSFVSGKLNCLELEKIRTERAVKAAHADAKKATDRLREEHEVELQKLEDRIDVIAKTSTPDACDKRVIDGVRKLWDD